MIADELTKEVSEEIHEYSRLVRSTGLWTLGLDERAPKSTRNRALPTPSEELEEQEMVAELLANYALWPSDERALETRERRQLDATAFPMIPVSFPSVLENRRRVKR